MMVLELFGTDNSTKAFGKMMVLKVKAPMMLEVLAMAVQPLSKETVDALAPAAVMEARCIGTVVGQGGFSTSGGHGGVACQTAAIMEVGRIQMTVTTRAKKYI